MSTSLLLLPLVDRVVEAGRDLMELYDATGDIGDKDKHNLERAIQVLVDTPMCVSLLQKTEIGKTLKEVIKLSRDKAQSSSTHQTIKASSSKLERHGR
jgi:Tfp pilus assembly ATPase PilU